MYEQINFEITQLQFLEAAMAQPALAGFKPDAKTLAQVTGLRTGAEAAKVAHADKLTAWQSTRGATAGECGNCRDTAVKVFGAMRSVYRSLPDVGTQLRRVPKRGSTARAVADRMLVTSAVWADLPNPPGTTTPFQLGTLTRTVFDGMATAFQAKVKAEIEGKAAFVAAQSALSQQVLGLGSFIRAAIAQGRSLYPEGTEARSWIDAIPMEPSTQPPGQVVISLAESTEPGAVHLQFDGARATSFQVWHKGPEDESFALVTEVIRPGPSLPGDYSATDLASGAHEYQVVGVNSRGEGPASVASTVEVGGAAPAQGAITFAESQAEGAVHLFYEAEGATSYQVWHKGPSDPGFTQVGTTITGEYVVFGLAGGMHAYKIAGVNDQGTGALSEPVSLDVAEAQAA